MSGVVVIGSGESRRQKAKVTLLSFYLPNICLITVQLRFIMFVLWYIAKPVYFCQKENNEKVFNKKSDGDFE